VKYTMSDSPGARVAICQYCKTTSMIPEKATGVKID